MKPSFGNKRAFYKYIDTLPRGPKWECEPFVITGDELDKQKQPRTELVYLWKQNPVECIQELIRNLAFREHLWYTPEKVYKDCNGDNQMFDEMWTSDWWWNLQVRFHYL